MNDDIIVAIATSRLEAAISIIRLSGKGCIAFVQQFFTGKIMDKASHTITYGFIKDQDEKVDEVLVNIYRGHRTFTGEEMVEINCHGGIFITQKVLNLCLKMGARMAEHGEFSKRAFLNGRIDLMNAEAIMDLSSFGDTRVFRRKLTAECPAILGTVPIYDAIVYYNKPLKDITSREWIDVFKMHAEDGVDFMTIHCGLNRSTAARFKQSKRLLNLVSRGGSLIFSWMELTGNENPFFEFYDDILEICRQYDVTLSLGDACRPGCIADAGDVSQIEELVVLGELTARAWEKDVQVMVEGPGHMALNQIQANMEIQQTLCKGAPFYVLGPLVTDIAPGYDHITAAIGGAIAATYGASFLCYVTPAEHLRLPTVEDVKEGIIASKIAAHAADVAKGLPGAADWDYRMGQARRTLDWERQFELAIDPEKARRYRAQSQPEHSDTCTMCGKMCSVRNMNKILNGENVDIME